MALRLPYIRDISFEGSSLSFFNGFVSSRPGHDWGGYLLVRPTGLSTTSSKVDQNYRTDWLGLQTPSFLTKYDAEKCNQLMTWLSTTTTHQIRQYRRPRLRVGVRQGVSVHLRPPRAVYTLCKSSRSHQACRRLIPPSISC